jgi:hypothetical protein
MMNKCTGYWLDNFVWTTHLQDLPNLPFLCGYDVLNRTVRYIINCAQDWNWIIYTSLMTFKTFSIMIASYDYNKVLKIWVWIEFTSGSLLKFFRRYMYASHTYFYKKHTVLKAVYHYGLFACVDIMTDFNHVKNQLFNFHVGPQAVSRQKNVLG